MFSLLVRQTDNQNPSSVKPSNHPQSNQKHISQPQSPPKKTFNVNDIVIIPEEKETIEGENYNENNNDYNYHSDTDEIIELEPEGMPMIAKPTASYQPTLSHKSVDQICKSLHGSIGLFKGKNKRIQAFKNMVLTTTKSDRIAIRIHYRQKYKVSINRIITKNFGGAFRQLLLYSMMNNDELMVNEIEYALKHKNINQLSSVLCTLDNETLKSVQNAFNKSPYHKNKNLRQWTNGLTSNLFYKRSINKLLIRILDGKRENDGFVDMKKINKDCKILYKHLVNATKQSDINKELLIKLFTARSFEHLYYVSLKYEQLYGKSLYDQLKSVFNDSSSTGYAILLILRYCINKYDVYASFLAKSLYTNDGYESLMRFIMFHYDYDLTNIIDKYGKSALDSWVKLELRNKGKVDTANIISKFAGLA
mmetsp:Transcript_47456/g.42549  ORF Transcript_47456/g.42549 Transcript_47456/m.42549 type:complete len:421 (-) Transcript_47456:65-1327(-)